MAAIDRLKEEIGFLKLGFAVLSIMDVILIGWMVQNFSKASPLVVSLMAFIVIAMTSAILLINRQAYKKINQLEDL